MIGFNSENIIIDFRSVDNIGFDQFVNGDRLNYIFENYLYYRQEESINDTYIKYIYDLNIDKFDDVLVDNNLSNIEKVFLIYYMICALLNSSEISIITTIINPQKLNIIQSTKISGLTTGVLVNNLIGIEAISNYLYTVNFIEAKEYNISPIDDYAFSLKEINHKSLTGQFVSPYSYYNIPQPDLMLVKSPEITNEEWQNITTNSVYKNLFNNSSSYLNIRDKFNGFVFELNFYGNVKYLQLGPTVENYKFKDILFEKFSQISSILGTLLFDFNQYSYISSVASKYPLTYYDTISRTTVTISSNPYLRWDKKFKFQHLDQNDLPSLSLLPSQTYTSQPGYGKGSQLSLYYFIEDIKWEFYTVDDILTDYLISEYHNDTTIFTSLATYSFFMDIYINNIRKHKNNNTKQIEYWDTKGDFINNTIGAVEDTEYVDIQGFDSTTNLPIVLYISKNIDIGGFISRVYKVSIGGIVPLNNSSLIFQYGDGVDYIFQITVSSASGFQGDWQDYNQLHNYVHGLNWDFDQRYLINKTFSDENQLYIGYNKQTLPKSVSFYLYKTDGNNIPISTENETIKLLPYEVLTNIMSLTTENEVFNELDKLFYRNNETIEEIDYIYNSSYFSYTNIIIPSYYYLFDDNNKDKIYNFLNYKLIDSLYKQIKKEELTKLYSTKQITDYTFANTKDFCTIDITNYGNLDNFKDTILSIITPYTYDTDDTNIYEIDETLSILIGKDLNKMLIENPEDKYIMAFQDFKKVMNTLDKIFIFNKVIGIDQYGYFSLQSDDIDNTFSGYFLNSVSNDNTLIMLLDLDEGKLKSVGITELNFNSSSNNPITFSKEFLKDPVLYQIPKNELTLIIDEYKKYNHIYNLTNLDVNDIVYSWSSISREKGLVIDPSQTDIIIIK